MYTGPHSWCSKACTSRSHRSHCSCWRLNSLPLSLSVLALSTHSPLILRCLSSLSLLLLSLLLFLSAASSRATKSKKGSPSMTWVLCIYIYIYTGVSLSFSIPLSLSLALSRSSYLLYLSHFISVSVWFSGGGSWALYKALEKETEQLGFHSKRNGLEKCCSPEMVHRFFSRQNIFHIESKTIGRLSSKIKISLHQKQHLWSSLRTSNWSHIFVCRLPVTCQAKQNRNFLFHMFSTASPPVNQVRPFVPQPPISCVYLKTLLEF